MSDALHALDELLQRADPKDLHGWRRLVVSPTRITRDAPDAKGVIRPTYHSRTSLQFPAMGHVMEKVGRGHRVTVLGDVNRRQTIFPRLVFAWVQQYYLKKDERRRPPYIAPARRLVDRTYGFLR